MISGIRDAEKELVEPMLCGTEDVLGAVERVASVKCVVLGLQRRGYLWRHRRHGRCRRGRVYRSALEYPTSSMSHQPDDYSKVCAEQRAWEINVQ